MPERGFSLEDSDYGMQMGYEAYLDEGLWSTFLCHYGNGRATW